MKRVEEPSGRGASARQNVPSCVNLPLEAVTRLVRAHTCKAARSSQKTEYEHIPPTLNQRPPLIDKKKTN